METATHFPIPEPDQLDHGILGHRVLYRVNAWEAEVLNSLRAGHQEFARTSPGAVQRGYVARVGNLVKPDQCYPATVVRDWRDGKVNLQVQLDGQDTHWACSAVQSDDDDQVWCQSTQPGAAAAAAFAAAAAGEPAAELTTAGESPAEVTNAGESPATGEPASGLEDSPVTVPEPEPDE